MDHGPLVESSPAGILLVVDGRIAYANRAALGLFSEGSKCLDGCRLLDLVDPTSREDVRAHVERWQAGEDSSAVDVRLADGQRNGVDPFQEPGAARYLSLTGNRMPGEGAGTVQIVAHDVTTRVGAERALQESEERLALALAGAQEGVWDWNLDTNTVAYSARWKQMLGFADEEIEPNVSAWERLVHPDDRTRADRAHDSVAHGERATYEAEFRLRHKDGHYVHVLSRGYPVRRQPDGRVVRIVGTHLDLTERKRAEAERARSELLTRLVFAQEEERRRIAREMHDQFGEQLTALAQRIRLLKGAGTAGWRDHVEPLETIAQQLDRDVDQLVWELRPTALDDLGLRAALSNYVRNWSTRTGVPATLHMSGLMDDRLPPHTETALYRIAQEALTNVAKHARASNVEVMLERRADHVLLVVEDDGVGFDSASAEDADGGFGLMGMKERAVLVGATLEIESSPDGGTTVLVRVDAAEAMVDHV